MVALITALLAAVTEACKSYVARLDWEKTTHKENATNEIEDEIDACAANGTAADLLRIERLKQRLDALRQS